MLGPSCHLRVTISTAASPTASAMAAPKTTTTVAGARSSEAATAMVPADSRVMRAAGGEALEALESGVLLAAELSCFVEDEFWCAAVGHGGSPFGSVPPRRNSFDR